MKKGIDTVALAVSTTLGPKGCNVAKMLVSTFILLKIAWELLVNVRDY